MKYKVYDPKTKAAIIEAVTSARKAGKTWDEAHAEAIKAGCKGNLRNLLKMLYKSGVKVTKRRRRKAAPAAGGMEFPILKRGPGRPPKIAAGLAIPILKRGPGRPRKIAIGMPLPFLKRGPGRPSKAVAGMNGIEALVENVVRERVACVLDRAIAILGEAREG